MSVTDKDVLFEDNHLIAICKRAGDIVQVDETRDEPLEDMVKGTSPKNIISLTVLF